MEEEKKGKRLSDDGQGIARTTQQSPTADAVALISSMVRVLLTNLAPLP